jgi:DegV family protein with EDD domain
MANKFIISTDNCADYFKSTMDKIGVYGIPLKRIQGDKEFAEIYDSKHEFDNFYEEIKKGALPSTSQINPDEFVTHFKKILETEKTGDIIQISLSSALSGTHNSAAAAANELNPTLNGRKIYAFDSLTCSGGQMMQIDKFLELRENTSAEDAIRQVEKIRDSQQLLFTVDNLHHLKRGGRISAAKALVGTILGVKPVLTVNKNGKLAIVDKTRNNKIVKMYQDKMGALAMPQGQQYENERIYAMFATRTELFDEVLRGIKEKYPKCVIKDVQIGPIIGAHVGAGAMGICFCGQPRLDV